MFAQKFRLLENGNDINPRKFNLPEFGELTLGLGEWEFTI